MLDVGHARCVQIVVLVVFGGRHRCDGLFPPKPERVRVGVDDDRDSRTLGFCTAHALCE